MESRSRRWPDGLSDEALLAGLAVGDDDAGLAFTRRFQSRVFGVAVTLLHDAALAEDVAQEAFIRAWRHAGAYDPRRGTVAAWLMRITRNLAIDSLRLRRPQPIDPDVLAAFDLPADAESVDQTVIIADMAGQVTAAPSGGFRPSRPVPCCWRRSMDTRPKRSAWPRASRSAPPRPVCASGCAKFAAC
jgi:RNA polymerase sigma factor (sigma-70 family)